MKGLRRIHEKGYIHGSLNPTNILVYVSSDFGAAQLKIAGFGSAKEPRKKIVAKKKCNKFRFQGTPVYMSPESVALDEGETPLDIWSLWCTVMGMINGRLPWSWLQESDLICWLALSHEEPELPQNMSPQGNDFLTKCLVRDPRNRWTATMLLNHPIVVEEIPQNFDCVCMPCFGNCGCIKFTGSTGECYCRNKLYFSFLFFFSLWEHI